MLKKTGRTLEGRAELEGEARHNRLERKTVVADVKLCLCLRFHHIKEEARLSTTSLSFSKIDLDKSEEHTSELQSQSTISYAVFCLKKFKA